MSSAIDPAIIKEWEEKLARDGISHIYTHTDAPDFFYPEHEHPVYTAHVIVKGSMKIWQDGKEYNLKAGDRFDVPKDTAHSAKMGPHGCSYIIGIRI